MTRSLPTRLAASLGLALATVVVAILGAVLTVDSVGVVNRSVEALSSTSAGLLDRLATVLPLGFAFGAGMVAAVNPCGFAMLPAYLGLYLRGSVERSGSRAQRLLRAIVVSASVTVGFLVLFGIAGVAIGAGARWLAAAFPWIGLGTGVLLVMVGAWTWFGGTLYSGLGERFSQRVAESAGHGLSGYLAFGFAYGLASLSCTLPIFLAVLGSSLTVASLPQVALQLVLYGAGMGLVITVLTLALALFRQALVDDVRRAVRYVGPAGSALLLIAGAYIVYYWLTLGGLLPFA